MAAREWALHFCVGKSGAFPVTLEHTQTSQGEGGRAAVLGERNAGPGFGGGGGGGGARPDLTLLNSFSPVFFFSRVIKSRVSVGGARVGSGGRRGVSRW